MSLDLDGEAGCGLVILIGIIVLSFLLFICGHYTTEEGSKIGTITKISKEGLFCKTYEGQIIRGGINDGSGNIGAAFYFTVQDKSLLDGLNKAMQEMKEVKITYHRRLWAPCDSGSNRYFLDSFEVIK